MQTISSFCSGQTDVGRALTNQQIQWSIQFYNKGVMLLLYFETFILGQSKCHNVSDKNYLKWIANRRGKMVKQNQVLTNNSYH